MHKEGDHIVETPEEASGGEDTPGMVTVLRVSVIAVVVGFAVLLAVFFAFKAKLF
jgi:hypothetical protein